MKTHTEPASAAYRGYVLFALIVVYTINFIDRQILGILAIPIQTDLGLTDTQLGLMRGVSFALFYSTLGVPVAMLADRTNRVRIMTVALTLWSACTMACGLATNFLQLFLARMTVGVGEAGGVAPAYSIVSDYFPPQQRALALGIYSFGIPLGSAIGIVFGGVIATVLDWRSAFFIVGGLGLVIAPLFFLTVREPKRGGLDAPGAKAAPAKFGEVIATLLKKPSFWLLSIGGASSSIVAYGMFAWMPAFLVRLFGDELPGLFTGFPSFLMPPNPGPVLYAAYFYGAILAVGGVFGIWLGGAIADRYGVKHKGIYALAPAIAFALTIPFLIVGLNTSSLATAFFVFLLPTAFSLAWLGPALSAFQHMAPPNMRATAGAMFLLINNLIGLGFGDFFIGRMSDFYKAQYGNESLRYSMLTAVGFYVIAAGLYFIAAPRLKKDWYVA
ncbi:MAG: transporter [Alphaproteobacteria bacterium]|nr:MAG: transporter [Caulobacteraceae bacterium]TPW03675.1 MAG: transporter [Alphaproteobacteria bacterium]